MDEDDRVSTDGPRGASDLLDSEKVETPKAHVDAPITAPTPNGKVAKMPTTVEFERDWWAIAIASVYVAGGLYAVYFGARVLWGEFHPQEDK